MRVMIYLDSNVFIYPHTGEGTISGASILLLKKIASNEIEAGTSVLTWDEVNHVIGKEIGKNQASEQSKKMLVMPNLIFLDATEKIINKAQKLVETYNLRPRDAIHAATAIINNCTEIVSNDSDFDKVKELKRRKI